MSTLEAQQTGVFILDFQNAFMTLPLDPDEMPFNTSILPFGISRSRKPIYQGEPVRGHFLVWRVLGFGGHSKPLTYSRAATFAARSGQALLTRPRSQTDVAEGRLQLYVDDPILTVTGSIHQQHAAIDLLVLWWLCLGIPLSWSKGFFGDASRPHDWIGVTFVSRAPGTATVTLPESFVAALLVLVRSFSRSSSRTASLADAYALCGRAGRVAQVVPEARPFISALYAALAASLRSHHSGLREAPPRRVAVRRFRSAAVWLEALLTNIPFRLQHTIYASTPIVPLTRMRVEFDASPWGGGAVLWVDGQVSEFAILQWTKEDCSHDSVRIGVAADQTYWKFATSSA